MKQIILILIIITSVVGAQGLDTAKLDEFFERLEQNQQAMGSISIFQNGTEVYHKAIGFSDLEAGTKANQNTKYRIGSISKTFTATIIMQLIEEGKLSLNTKLSEYYPEIPNSQKITIAQLLKHRSGIYNFTDSSSYQSWMEQAISKKDLVAKISSHKSIFEPDSTAKYSNSNYVLLSFIAEDIEHKSFAELLKARIQKPCNLQNTYYGGKINTKDNEALSYFKLVDWEIATETDMSVPAGAGAVVSSPTDLNIFLNCLFSYKLISKESLDKMSEIQEGFGFGMGLFEASFDDKKALGHGGGIDGFQSMAFYFPEEKLTISYIANGVVYPVNDITKGVLSIYFNQDFELPNFKPQIVLSSEDLDKYLGVYAGPSLPLKIAITKEDNQLIAQATGQPSFPLTAAGNNTFVFGMANIEMVFLPTENKMIFKQAGAEFELERE